MNKQKQIEEMFKDVVESELRYNEYCLNKNCHVCEYYGDGECDNHIRAEYLYNAGYRKQEWISIEERLPDLQHEVLTYSECNGVRSACLVVAKYKNKVWYLYGTNKLSIEVTHWMPLPEAPKGGEVDNE